MKKSIKTLFLLNYIIPYRFISEIVSYSMVLSLLPLQLLNFTPDGLSNGFPQNSDPIKIGLMLSQDPSTDSLSLEAYHAIQYAVERVNNEGGLHGRNIEIVTRFGDGVWGSASKKSVELIFDEGVSAIIGSLDGRNAHLTQMAITKAQVIYLETRATDPTLSEINVPWFFRVVPSDVLQAEYLYEEILDNRKLMSLDVLFSNTFDDNVAANSFIRKVQRDDHINLRTFKYDPLVTDINETVKFLFSSESEGVVFFGNPSFLKKLMTHLEESEFEKTFFTTLSIFPPIPFFDGFDSKHRVSFICPQNSFEENHKDFYNNFSDSFGYSPGAVAAYSFDGINVLLDSIKHGGVEKEEIRDSLRRIQYTGGITGVIDFSSTGDILSNSTVCY